MRAAIQTIQKHNKDSENEGRNETSGRSCSVVTLTDDGEQLASKTRNLDLELEVVSGRSF
jgi:hypothetical protein